MHAHTCAVIADKSAVTCYTSYLRAMRAELYGAKMVLSITPEVTHIIVRDETSEARVEALRAAVAAARADAGSAAPMPAIIYTSFIDRVCDSGDVHAASRG